MKEMKYSIERAPLADYYVIAVKDKDTSNLVDTFTLNESAADILTLLCSGKDIKSVVEEIVKKYDAPVDIITKDVQRYAYILKEKNLIKK